MADDLSIFGGLPGGVDEDRLRAARRKLRLRNAFEPEGPLPPRPSASGVGGKGVTPGPPPAVPANTVAPAVTGTAAVGSTLSCSTGTWTHSPTSYSYSWISGSTQVGTAATYVIQAGDLGNNIFCRVQARNAAGFGTPATSNTVGPVSAAPTSTWSAADASVNSMTLSNGNLTVTANVSSSWQSVRGTISNTTGKVYVEFLTSAASLLNNVLFGLASSGFTVTSYLGSSNYSLGILGGGGAAEYGSPSGDFVFNYSIAGAIVASGDVVGMAFDFGSGKFWLGKNNIWLGTSNPATGVLPLAVVSGTSLTQAYFPALSLNSGSASGVWTLQATAASQTYAPPSGFTAWG